MYFAKTLTGHLFAMVWAVALAALPSIPVAEAQQEEAGKIHVDVNLVLVEATVKNKAGQVMDGLVMKDFEVREDGVPQTVSHFSRDQLPLAVALVVDLSSSIEPFSVRCAMLRRPRCAR